MEWINVNEQLPKEGSYLCFMNDCYIKMCYYNNTYWADMWTTDLKGIVRYWMPLPKSPKN